MKNHCNYWIFAFFRHNRNKYNLKEGMNDEKFVSGMVLLSQLLLLAGVATTIKKQSLIQLKKKDMIEENRKSDA